MKRVRKRHTRVELYASVFRNFTQFCLTACIGLCLIVSPAHANTLVNVIPDFYSEPGLYPNRDYLNQSATEHIDPFTGALQLHVTDIHIPGNGGFDLNVIRSYNSTSLDINNPSVTRSKAGLGWDIHFGRVLNIGPTLCAGPLTNAVLELADGSTQHLYFSTSGSPMMLTTQRWKAECLNNGSALAVYSPTGVRYDMTGRTDIDMGASLSVAALVVTKITDRNGNYVNINYADAYYREISNVTTSDGRSLTFTYADSGTTQPRISQITTDSGRSWTYSYAAVPGVASRYFLTQVTRPDGRSWNYSYNNYLDPGTTAGGYLMKGMTYPQVGSANYGYGFVMFDGVHRSAVVSSKSTSDGGNWSFTYTPGSTSTYDTTVVSTPSGMITYKHVGPKYATYGSVWMTGLLMQKFIGSAQTETYTWDKQLISNQQNSRPGNFSAVYDNVTYAPIMTSKTIARDGATYSTTYSSFDTYGNPQTVTESGTNGGNRTTGYAYYTNTSLWIINQPQNESGPAGTVTRGFDSYGNLTSQSVDGVTTGYSYTSAGDIYTKTDPRYYTTTYGSYKRGIPQSESRPEGVSISRVVDNAGNVTSETNGEYKTFTYSYDGLNRLTSIGYPVGNAASITYGTTTKTATRGSLTETTNYDGFGRVTSVNLGGITTTYSYDVLGRRTFQSSPNGGSSGTTFQYDILDRITRITNPDSTSKSISYSAGASATTDERSNTTSRAYRSYGDPNKQVLMSISTPVSSASVTLSRNGHDQITAVTQNGISRSYGYNSQYYLTSITNPETGTTTYGRDNIGNMTSRSVGSSGATNFTYDGLNRLTGISYPGSTPSVTKTYSKTNKLLSDNSSSATRSYGYDGNDNLTSESMAIDGITMAASYSYDGNDHLSSITYPRSNHVINLSPDALGRATQASPHVTGISYWPSGQINTLTHANGVTSSYGQNSRLWVSSFSAQRSGASYIGSSYSYDGNGNLLQISDSVDSHYNRTLQYDAIDRLTTANGSWGSGSYSYSGDGNISQRSLGSAALSYSYDSTNRLTSISGGPSTSFTYDAYGNIATGYGHTYAYDDGPNLTCFDCAGAGKIAYKYDGSNLRVSTDKGGVKTYSFYASGGKLLSEYTPASGNRLVEYIYVGDKRVAQRVTDDLYATTTTLSVSPTTVNAGDTVTMTATVSGSGGPTGQVTFKSGATVLGTASISGGSAILPISSLAANTYHVVAEYAGNTTNAGSVSTPILLTVNAVSKTSTNTSLSALPSPAYVGQTVTLKATVTGSGNPDGTVLFKDGASTLGPGTLSGGIATLDLSSLAAGSHSLVAEYQGNATNLQSASSSVPLTVNSQTTSSTSLTASPNPGLTGQTVTLHATVSGASPTGLVTFKDGATTLGSASLASGAASFSATFSAGGAHSLTAEYAGDGPNKASTSAPISEFIKTATSTTLSTTPNPSFVGQMVTLTATVTGASPGVNVTFYDGFVSLGAVAVVGTQASLQISSLLLGTHSLTASYAGDSNTGSSTSLPIRQDVIAIGSTSTSLAASPNPATVTQQITLTASITGNNPTGTVTFKEGTSSLGTATVAPGTNSATLTVGPLTAGTHTLIASYGGDGQNGSSISPPKDVKVTSNNIATITMLTGTANAVQFGDSVTLIATVSGAGGPTGTVTFKDGTNTLASATLVNGSASFTSGSYALGAHDLTAEYSGDAVNLASTSGIWPLTVGAAGASGIVLTATPNPGLTGQPITLTATVGGGSNEIVNFKDGTTILANPNLVSGTKQITQVFGVAGIHTLTAESGGYVSPPLSLSLKSRSVMDLSVKPLTSVFGQPVMLTASVWGILPIGNVTFKDGANVRGTAGLVNGVATFSVSDLSVGVHNLTATYEGDAYNSTSAATGVNTRIIAAGTSSTELTITPYPPTLATPVTLKADIVAMAPIGTVTFTDGATVLGTVSVDNSSASLPIGTLAAGAHALTATYNGDGQNAASASYTYNVWIADITNSTTSLTSSANPARQGTPVTLTATVGGSWATGTITFKEGSTVLGTAVLDYSSAVLTLPNLALGTHNLTAEYSGDAAYHPSTSAVLAQEIHVGNASTTSWVSYPNSLPVGQSLNLEVNVVGSNPTTGTVTFKDGATVLMTAAVTYTPDRFHAVVGGITGLAPGWHTISAEYSGDGNNLPSAINAQVNVTTGSTPSTTVLAATPLSSNVGQVVTLSAEVVSVNPTGTVQFMDGGAPLGLPQLVAGNTASLPLDTLAAGDHAITAVYSGDSVNAASTSNAVHVAVAKRATTAALTVSPQSAALNQLVTLNATVTGSGLGGIVNFMDGDGATLLAAVPLSNGTATLLTGFQTAGTHNLSAVYMGDGANLGSASGTIALTIARVASAIAWDTGYPSPSPFKLGQALNLSVTITGGTPQGTVTFLDGSTTLGMVSVVNGGGTGSAQLLGVTGLTVGMHTITAQYSGDASNDPSTITAQVFVRNPAAITPIMMLLLLDD